MKFKKKTTELCGVIFFINPGCIGLIVLNWGYPKVAILSDSNFLKSFISSF